MADAIEAVASATEIHCSLKSSRDEGNPQKQIPAAIFASILPIIAERLRGMETYLTNDTANRLFHSVKKLQPATILDHNSILTGIKSRLEMSLGREPFNNSTIVDCYGYLKSFPYSDTLKEVLILLGRKVEEILQEGKASYFNCAQYAKVSSMKPVGSTHFIVVTVSTCRSCTVSNPLKQWMKA